MPTEHEAAASRIQTAARAFLFRTRLRRHGVTRRSREDTVVRNEAAFTIQRAFRYCMMRRRGHEWRASRRNHHRPGDDAALQQERQYALDLIQLNWLASVDRTIARQQRQAAIRNLQNRSTARAELQEREEAARKIQQAARSAFVPMRPAVAPPVDTVVSQRQAVIQERIAAALIMQRLARRWLWRNRRADMLLQEAEGRAMQAIAQEEEYMEVAAIHMQRYMRRYVARRHAAEFRREREESAHELRRTEAHDVIRRWWRCYSARHQVAHRNLLRRREYALCYFNEAATLIQSNYRRHLWGLRGREYMLREAARRRHTAAVHIQCAWRQRLARDTFRRHAVEHVIAVTSKRLHDSATSIQSLARGVHARQVTLPLRRLEVCGPRVAQLMNALVQGYRYRRSLYRLRRENKAAVRIQRTVRTFLAKRRTENVRWVHERDRARRRLLYCVVRLQAHFRGCLARQRARALRLPPAVTAAVIKLQAHIRGRFARTELLSLKALACRDEELESLGREATLIQAGVRGYLARISTRCLRDAYHNALHLVQRAGRGLLLRRRLPSELFLFRRHNAAKLIGQTYRQHTQRRLAKEDLRARRETRLRNQERRAAATVISSRWRGHRDRRRVRAMLEQRRLAVLHVQSYLRSAASLRRTSALVHAFTLGVYARRIQHAWSIAKPRMAEKTLARGLELRLIAMDQKALLQRETLNRHYLGEALHDEYVLLVKQEKGDRDAITSRAQERESRWLARTPAGVQLESAKTMQASARSFSTRRRLLMSAVTAAAPSVDDEALQTPPDAVASTARALPVDVEGREWFDWLLQLRDAQRLTVRASFTLENLLREQSGARAQLIFEEGALRKHVEYQRQLAHRGALAKTSMAASGTHRAEQLEQPSVLTVPKPPGVAAMTATHIREALRAHYHKPHLSSLAIAKVGLMDAALPEIVAFIEANPNITLVDLRGNRVTDVGASQLLSAVTNAGRLLSVDVSDNFVCDRYVKELADAGRVGRRRHLPPPSLPSSVGAMRRPLRSLPFEPVAKVIKVAPKSLLDELLHEEEAATAVGMGAQQPIM